MNGYDLSRNFWDWAFENPEIISPNHAAIYFFAVEHCNRLGWKDKFGFPSQMTMDAIGIKKHQTYIKYFNELVDIGFIKLVQKSKNQYSANIISLQNAMPKKGKALDKALIKHGAKQTETNGQSTGQSNSSVYKQVTKNKEPLTINYKKTLLSEITISDFPNLNSEILEITLSFQKLFIANLEEVGVKNTSPEKATGEWYDDIRLLKEKDGYAIEDFREIWNFLKNDTFWKKNVISTNKLRGQFERLLMEARSNTPKQKEESDMEAFKRETVNNLNHE